MNMESSTSLKEEKVPLRSRVWVSAADGACAILGGLAGAATLTYFFVDWRGLDGNLASIVWLIYAIWNAFNDPLFGYISDRTKSKLGRRIPYIRYGAPIYIFSFIACWINWPGTQVDQWAMFFQMLFILFVFDTLYTAIATSIYVMPYEMAVSNKARSDIFIWKIIFQVIALVFPLIVVNLIKPQPGQDATQFTLIMSVLGIIMGIIIYISTYFYHENQYQQAEEQFHFVAAFKETFKNKSFLIFLVFSFTVIYVQTGLLQGVLYYFDAFPAIPMFPSYGALGGGIIVGITMFLKKRDVWGVRKCLMLYGLLFSIGCFAVAFLGSIFVFALIGFFFFGIGFSGGMYLIPIQNGDVIDYDEHVTHLRREGMYAGVNSFMTKPANSIAQALFLTMRLSTGWVEGILTVDQSTSAKTGFLLAWTLIPGILLLICFIAMRWYPLDGKEWQDIKLNLSQQHVEKEKAYLAKLGLKYSE